MASLKESNRIIIDSNEAVKCAEIKDYLSQRFNVRVQHLDAGDYLFGSGICVERKTGLNFYQDVVSRHLWEQLEKLVNLYEKPVLMLEDLSEVSRYDFAPIVHGALISLINWKKLKILTTLDAKDSKALLSRLAVYAGPRGEKPVPSFVRKGHSSKEVRAFMLQCIRGIGPKMSSKVLAEYSTFEQLIKAEKAELTRLIGKAGAKLYNVLHNR